MIESSECESCNGNKEVVDTLMQEMTNIEENSDYYKNAFINKTKEHQLLQDHYQHLSQVHGNVFFFLEECINSDFDAETWHKNFNIWLKSST